MHRVCTALENRQCAVLHAWPCTRVHTWSNTTCLVCFGGGACCNHAFAEREATMIFMWSSISAS